MAALDKAIGRLKQPGVKKRIKIRDRPEWRLDKPLVFAVFVAVRQFMHDVAWAVE